MQINYAGGIYALYPQAVAAGATASFDFRQLRDRQTPDSSGRVLPLDFTIGQIRWSQVGGTATTLIGRSEIISKTDKISSSYSCNICCRYSYQSSRLTPDQVFEFLGGTTQLAPMQKDRDCYGNYFAEYEVSNANWDSSDASIVEIYNGTATALDVGDVQITATWNTQYYLDSGSDTCDEYPVVAAPTGEMVVRPPQVQIGSIDSVEEGGIRDVTITITGGKNTPITFNLRKINNDIGGVTFSDGSLSKSITPNTNQPFSVTYTIKGVISSSDIDDYRLQAFYNNGRVLATELFTVTDVQFQEHSSCSGFDNTDTSQLYLSVPQNGSNTVKAKIIPSGASGNFSFQAQTGSGISVSPSSITSGEQTLTITGGSSTGSFTVKAFGNQATDAAATLNIAVLKRVNKTVKIHAIAEENDDVQTIAVGTTAIRTSVACVTIGNNNFRDTVPSGDDQILTDASGKEYISVGANKICETTAKSTNVTVSSSDVPSATALQTALNNTYWGKQANIHFTVTRGQDYTVNFDLDRDNLINSESPVEPAEIILVAQDSSVDFNLYYLGLNVKPLSDGRIPSAFSNSGVAASFFSPTRNGTITYLAAHEIGHLLGASGSSNALDLMFEMDSSNSPCRIRKRDWDLVNP